MSFENGFTDVVGGNPFRAEESSVEASDTLGCSRTVGKFNKDVSILRCRILSAAVEMSSVV
jgi:hypothetical protein